jgi:predicted dehydrogenase
VRVSRPPARLAVVGAGHRGLEVYGAAAARHLDLVRIVAVAEPRPQRLARLADAHGVERAGRFADWRQLLAGVSAGTLAVDGVIVATPDREHVAPAVQALALGLDVLLEKPIAPDEAGVRRVEDAARRSSGRVTVAHVLRHAPLFTRVKALIDDGAVGELIGIDHVEHVGHWHFAHSYVRGSYRREVDASPMLLAKACHDLDLIRWMVGRPARRVASFGSLRHFTAASAPRGAPERCTDGCPVEATCPYAATRIYLGRFGGRRDWPNSMLDDDPTPERVLGALQTGPYGRCVYRCDNDVVDHQVVALDFDGGARATLTVTAFSEASTRTVRVWGTHGEIDARFDHGDVTLHDFRTGRTSRSPVPPDDGHRDADARLARDWFGRLASRTAAPTELAVSIESHLLAFTAEAARKSGRVVTL